MNADPAGDLICNLESYAGNIISQTIRILLHYLIGPVAILLIDLHRQRH